MSTDILADILAHKRAELASRAPRERPRRSRTHHSLSAALARPGMRLLVECKRASPSAGVLYGAGSLQPLLDACTGIADAFSVLTDKRYFDGSLEDLAFVAAAVDVPVLCKDFILEPSQVHDAHAFGADAVLLMLSALDDEAYRLCAEAADSLQLEVLTEIHDERELERALALGAGIVGINNRAFTDLSVDTGVTRRLAPQVPDGRLVVCESGITGHGIMRELAPMVDGFLVGSSLSGASQVDFAVRELAFGEVKLCGLTRAEDAVTAWGAGARWGGVVFAAHSPRQVTPGQARRIAAASPLPLVGVFTDSVPGAVASIARQVPLAAVQLHGGEDEEYITTLRGHLPPGCAIWKALRVHTDLPVVTTSADLILYDNGIPGSGKTFDWSLLPGVERMRHHGIAGGIHAGNIAAAYATGARLIDVGSGVESAPGIKSTAGIAGLFEAARG